MKRVISLILATIMAFGMVACAQNGASNNGASTDASSNSETGNNTTNDTSSNASSSHPYLTTVPEDTKLKMGFVVMDISNPYFVESVKGAQAFADRHGYDLTVIDGGSNGGYPFQIVEDDLYCPVGGIPYTSVIASFRCDDVDRHKGFFEKRYFVGKGETNGVVELSRLHGSERYAVCFDARQAAVAGVESSQDPFHEL